MCVASAKAKVRIVHVRLLKGSRHPSRHENEADNRDNLPRVVQPGQHGPCVPKARAAHAYTQPLGSEQTDVMYTRKETSAIWAIRVGYHNRSPRHDRNSTTIIHQGCSSTGWLSSTATFTQMWTRYVEVKAKSASTPCQGKWLAKSKLTLRARRTQTITSSCRSMQEGPMGCR